MQRLAVFFAWLPLTACACNSHGGMSSVFAQNNQFGNIHGVVSDSSGAHMPGMMITLTTAVLLAPRSAPSDSGGNYHFEQLPVGAYRIAAAEPGFQQYVRDGIPDHCRVFSRSQYSNDCGRAERDGHGIRREPYLGHHFHHGLHQRKLSNRSR
jgi:hypothetical protein